MYTVHVLCIKYILYRCVYSFPLIVNNVLKNSHLKELQCVCGVVFVFVCACVRAWVRAYGVCVCLGYACLHASKRVYMFVRACVRARVRACVRA